MSNTTNITPKYFGKIVHFWMSCPEPRHQLNAAVRNHDKILINIMFHNCDIN